MIGAIAGDIIGSIFERRPIKTKHFELFSKHSRFTDDTVLSMAVADCLLNKKDFAEAFHFYGNKYPECGFGKGFREWLTKDDKLPYSSFGNGSAMRISPVGFYFNSLDEVLAVSEKSAIVTHNHPEAIKGAQAVASAIFLARTGRSKEEIKNFISNQFDYDLDQKLDSIRESYQFDVSCQGSVPESIISFLESVDYEDAVRNAISLGGDSDTMACIAGGIAQAFYKKIPEHIVIEVVNRLNPEFLLILETFEQKASCIY